MKDKEIEFLKESNAIEREYSEEALEDSKDAWEFARRHSHMINIDFVRGVHRQIMKSLNPRIAGKIRRVPVYVGNRFNYRECLKPELIEDKLKELCKFQPANPKDFGLDERTNEGAVKDWHIRFEKIHPFEDGNGRVGRIIMNIQRLNIGLPILIIHEGEEQFEYYKWFREETS